MAVKVNKAVEANLRKVIAEEQQASALRLAAPAGGGPMARQLEAPTADLRAPEVGVRAS